MDTPHIARFEVWTLDTTAALAASDGFAEACRAAEAHHAGHVVDRRTGQVRWIHPRASSPERVAIGARTRAGLYARRALGPAPFMPPPAPPAPTEPTARTCTSRVARAVEAPVAIAAAPGCAFVESTHKPPRCGPRAPLPLPPQPAADVAPRAAPTPTPAPAPAPAQPAAQASARPAPAIPLSEPARAALAARLAHVALAALQPELERALARAVYAVLAELAAPVELPPATKAPNTPPRAPRSSRSSAP